MESRAVKAKAIAAEKAKQIKHDDNLKIEGSMEGMQRRGTITLSSNKETSAKKEDNLTMNGSFAARTQSSNGHKDQSTYSSTSNLSQTSAVKSQQSSGISGAMHQTGKEEAAISAISKDKFMSSLRESSGVILGQQKELSVIDSHHRKQSQQRQRQDTAWDTRATGLVELGSGHTGRTAAHGGRDYEYSASMSRGSASRQSLSTSWATQEVSSTSMSRAARSSQSCSMQQQQRSECPASIIPKAILMCYVIKYIYLQSICFT